jgi:hypothetical protein
VVNIETNGGGFADIVPYKDTYQEDAEVTLMATPDEGWCFSRWIGSVSFSMNPHTFWVDDNYSLKAIFSKLKPVPPISDYPAQPIFVWYGNTQSFGHLGIPQQWVNILGSVGDGIELLWFSLNGGPECQLNIGPDPRRLMGNGSFNIDIHIDDLLVGANTVVIHAASATEDFYETVTVNWDNTNHWPLPYSIDWSEVGAIHDVAQPVDGLWEITDEGLHTVKIGYDRLVVIGDIEWDSYVVTVPITIHEIDEEAGDKHPSGGPGVGILTLWQGHTANHRQPHTQYWPYGAIGWYRWNATGRDRLEIYASPSRLAAFDSFRGCVIGATYIFKFRAEVIDGAPHYSLKMWEEEIEEPAEWDLETVGDPTVSYLNGSVLLLAHHVNATFGDVTIEEGNSLR